MDPKHQIRTVTMARIYAQQGHHRKAAEIYRYLLKLEPSRQDIAAALAEVEAKQHADTHTGEKGIKPLVQEWIRLAMRYRQLQKLRQLKENLPSIKNDGESTA